MFNLAKFKLQLILGLGVLVLLTAAWFGWKSLKKENETLKETVTLQKVENGALKDTVSKQEESAVVTESITTEWIQRTEEVAKQHDQVWKKSKDKIEKIEKLQPDSKLATNSKSNPPVPPTTLSKDDQISEVIIDGLWENYCLAVPGAMGCGTST